MNKNVPATTIRQARLRFEEDNAWERLPPSVRCACQALLAQLLVAVVQSGSEVSPNRPRSDDERQD